MAWTKAKTAVVVGAALILAAGASIVAVKKVHSAKEMKINPLLLQGLPRTSAELNAWYVEPPAGQNAATYDLRGIQAMQMDEAGQTANLPVLGKSPPPPPGARLSPQMKSALAVFLQRNRAALQCFAQGAEYDQSRYPIDLTKDPNTKLPHLMGIKHGMQLAEMAAILDAANNDGKQAADDVLATLALAGSLKAEPILISQLVRAAGVSLTVEALNQVVNRTTLSSESLNELSRAFQEMEDYDARGEGFDRALTGERANHLPLLQNRDELFQYLTMVGNSSATDEQNHRMMIEHLKQPGSLKAERDFFEATFEQLLSARQEPFPDRMSAVTGIIRERQAKARHRGLLLNEWYWDGFAGSVNREAKCLADSRLALTAVALEQFRAAHDRYPASLTELTPNYLDATPVDPFDGRSLRYRQQGVGYVLYSVGWDLKDDGGKRMNRKVGDIVFAVITPPMER